jgi:hypothetical protein
MNTVEFKRECFSQNFNICRSRMVRILFLSFRRKRKKGPSEILQLYKKKQNSI